MGSKAGWIFFILLFIFAFECLKPAGGGIVRNDVVNAGNSIEENSVHNAINSNKDSIRESQELEDQDVTEQETEVVEKAEIKTRWSPKSYCQKREFFIDFYYVGWDDWILAPPGYSAGICEGVCHHSLNSKGVNMTNHAVVMSTLNSNIPAYASNHPCCVPTKLSSLSVLFEDTNGKMVIKKFDDMVVEECGCQ